MPLPSDKTTLAQLDLLLKSLTFLFTALLALKAIWEYIRAQRWKRFEFIADQLKDFNSDPQVRKVMTLLDWQDREIELFPERETNKSVLVTNELLISSLHPNDYGPTGDGYTEEQARIRELFDVFFDKISFFSVVLQSRLIRRNDLDYLKYWLDRIASPNYKGTKFVTNISGYIKYYGYNDVISLLRRFGYQKAT